MTITLSTVLRMHRASVAALAPSAPGQPCVPASAVLGGLEDSSIPAPAFGSRLEGSHRGGRFDGITLIVGGSGQDWQDQAQLAGGGPLRG